MVSVAATNRQVLTVLVLLKRNNDTMRVDLDGLLQAKCTTRSFFYLQY